MSKEKRKTVQLHFVRRCEEIEALRKDTPGEELLMRFSLGGAIWRIFWLHCWQPARFPIYDQHVHRAMRFIESGTVKEIPTRDPDEVDSYLNAYLAFHGKFNGSLGREVDKALWSFGKFLSTNRFPIVPK